MNKSRLSAALSAATVAPTGRPTVDGAKVRQLAALPASARERAAGKALPKAIAAPVTTALVIVPTALEAAQIVDALAGESALKEAKAQIKRTIENGISLAIAPDDAAALAQASAYLSAGLAPVMVASCKGSDWHARTVLAWGKAEADARSQRAQEALKKAVIRAVTARCERLFVAVDWAAGSVLILDALSAPMAAPKGVQQAGYDTAKRAALARFSGAVEAAGKAANVATAKSHGKEAAQREATTTPVAAPAMATAKDTDAFRDALATVRAGLKDSTADRYAMPDLVALASELAKYMAARTAREGEAARQRKADKAAA